MISNINMIYNRYFGIYVYKKDLKNGVYFCSRCKGTGILDFKLYLVELFSIVEPCPKCGGLGSIDWIENIVGRKKDKLVIKLVVLVEAI